MTDKKLDAYVRSLDLYIVSHGGVGSNYLVEYLLEKGINTKSDQNMYQLTCHRARYVKGVRTICVRGDYGNAILSMHQRKVLTRNASKIWYNSDTDRRPLKHYLKEFHYDPVGIEQIELTFKDTDAEMLWYPYSQSSIRNALQSLDFDVDLSDIQIKPRDTVLGTVVNHYRP